MSNSQSKERYVTIRDRHRCFSPETLGSYNFFTQIVEFTSLSEVDLDKLVELYREHKESGNTIQFSDELYSLVVRVHPILAHEYTHFIDATSTVWGLRLLRDIYFAYNIQANESQYFHAKHAADQVKKIKMPSYYSTSEESVSVDVPWRYQITCGSIFDQNGHPSKRQIPFLRFLNSSNEPFARCPISLLSMLEASATYQELNSFSAALRLLPEDKKLVENALLEERFLKRLYNRNFTEYSVCTHFVANWHAIKDAAPAYHLTAAFVRLSLNIATSDISKFSISKEVSSIIFPGQFPQRNEVEEKFNASLKEGDRAVLFTVLVRVMKAIFPLNKSFKEAYRDVLASALQHFDLELSDIESNSRSEYLKLHEEFRGLKLVPEALSNAIFHNFNTFDEIYSPDIKFPQMQLPPAFYADLKQRPSFLGQSKNFGTFNLEDHADALYPHVMWMTDFSDACI